MRKNRRSVIGLTGGIASGKSLVLKQFKALGAKTLDCDIIAKEVVEPGKIAYSKIIQNFGETVCLKDGTLNRKKLGRIIFSNSQKRKLLESIVHPKVIQGLKNEIQLNSSNLLVCDIPLLYEAKLEPLVDKIVVVWASQKDQLERLLKRNGYTRKEALERISSQWPVKKKCQRADFVIDNSNSKLKTKLQVENLFRILTKNN